MREYLWRDRKGSVQLARDVAVELDPAAAVDLCANNLDARLRYAEISARHLRAALSELPTHTPIFWVTFINRDHAVREDAAAAFQVDRLHRWVRRLLRGCNFVGMVEAALFTNLDVTGAGYKRTVSWHSHLLVWGVTKEIIGRICKGADARYATLVPGVTVAHYRPIFPAQVGGCALYMHKGQISEYRVWARRRTVFDSETGEITIEGTGRFRQAKRSLRPGDMARMCRVFAGRTLDNLAFSGGGGRPVLAAIRDEALAPFRRLEDRKAARRAIEAAREVRRTQAVRRPARSKTPALPSPRPSKHSATLAKISVAKSPGNLISPLTHLR